MHKESSTEHEHDSALEAVQAIEALSWSTGVKDTGVLNGLLASLPEWSIKEQILAYRDAHRQKSIVHKDCKLLVEPTLWHSRIKVAEAFDSFLQWTCGFSQPTSGPTKSEGTACHHSLV